MMVFREVARDQLWIAPTFKQLCEVPLILLKEI